MAKSAKKLKVTLVKSLNARLRAHKDCARGLGLTRIRSSVEVDGSNPCIMGMINKIDYLVKVEEL